jgi:hypothetical protein
VVAIRLGDDAPMPSRTDDAPPPRPQLGSPPPVYSAGGGRYQPRCTAVKLGPIRAGWQVLIDPIRSIWRTRFVGSRARTEVAASARRDVPERSGATRRHREP